MKNYKVEYDPKLDLKAVYGEKGSAIFELPTSVKVDDAYGAYITPRNIQIIRPIDLYNEEILSEINNEQYCIYMFVKKPRITYERLNYYKNEVRFSLRIANKIEDEIIGDYGVYYENHIEEGNAKLNYPFHTYEVIDSKGKLFSHPAPITFDRICRENEQHHDALDFEVIYVGQTKQEKIQKRLNPHHKLQKVLSEVNTNEPDQEIYIILFDFNIQFMMQWNKDDKDASKKQKAAIKKFRNISTEQKITLVEGALMKYFNTKDYNEKLIVNYPSVSQGSIKEAFENGISHIYFELGLPDLGGRLYSKEVEPKNEHLFRFDYETKNEMLNFVENITFVEVNKRR